MVASELRARVVAASMLRARLEWLLVCVWPGMGGKLGGGVAGVANGAAGRLIGFALSPVAWLVEPLASSIYAHSPPAWVLEGSPGL